MTQGLHTGVAAALAAAALFGAATPLAKLLLADSTPLMLAALLYLGSGCGLWLLRRVRRAPAVRLQSGERGWFAGAIFAGGVVGPALLMFGLSGMAASEASLLLNAEAVLTALLAWFVFKENVDGRVATGMLSIVAGSVVLAWPQQARIAGAWPALTIIGACLAWAIDNNLTRRVSLSDASFIAMVKGLVAGGTNLTAALLWGAELPSIRTIGAAALLGFASYGVSLVLFVVSLRDLGTARTSAYFSVAPLVGAALAVGLLGEPVTLQLVIAAALMALGVGLHMSERHHHVHVHEATVHVHEHVHGNDDVHHDHRHDEAAPPGTRHTHRHVHAQISHAHGHYPDAHHRHTH